MPLTRRTLRAFAFTDAALRFGPGFNGNGDRKSLLQDLPNRPITKAATPRHVLVVEDNLDGVHSLVLLLQEMGHHVDYAINGYAAFDLVKRMRPEIVFLDLNLPGISGFEVCKRIKSDPALKNIRVIALTAYSQDEYRQNAMKAGCEQFLVKPVDWKVFEDLLA